VVVQNDDGTDPLIKLEATGTGLFLTSASQIDSNGNPIVAYQDLGFTGDSQIQQLT
jgi:hypothetical protein